MTKFFTYCTFQGSNRGNPDKIRTNLLIIQHEVYLWFNKDTTLHDDAVETQSNSTPPRSSP